MISFDRRTSKYNFRTYLASGATGDNDLLVLDNGWRWGLQSPAGQMRYTITLDGPNRWIEIGEISKDGTVWRKFFEMTLERSAP